jgi:ADP-ribosylglycohydrolase
MNTDRIRLLLSGLAAGDSIGSLTEFVPQDEVPQVFARHEPDGWPFVPVRGPVWELGEPTDDTQMAMAIVRAFLERGGFDGGAVAKEFVAWFDSRPKDIGGTTARALSRVRSGVPWHEGGLPDFQARPSNAANGSLMRNGVVAALADDLDAALIFSLHHAIITHYDPLSAICCGAQTWLLRQLLDGDWPLVDAWLGAFSTRWMTWLDETDDAVAAKWRHNVRAELKGALDTFLAAAFPPEPFDPFAEDFVGRWGYCLLTLQVALWALEWSARDEPFPTPEGFPPEVFERRGVDCIGWPAMVGYDADTYGATAGPLITAAHGLPPHAMAADLWAVRELDDLLGR